MEPSPLTTAMKAKNNKSPQKIETAFYSTEMVLLKKQIEKTGKFVEKTLSKTWELNKIA